MWFIKMNLNSIRCSPKIGQVIKFEGKGSVGMGGKKKYTSQFKAKVALKAAKAENTISQIALVNDW